MPNLDGLCRVFIQYFISVVRVLEVDVGVGRYSVFYVIYQGIYCLSFGRVRVGGLPYVYGGFLVFMLDGECLC